MLTDPGGIDRFEDGKLWDLLANEFKITSNTITTTVTVENLPDGTIPEGGGGPITFQDDDFLQDGQDVPMPDTSTVAEAMAEAFVDVLFDVGDNNDSVPFDLNVEENEGIATMDWDSAGQNSQPFWVAYLLGAFQGPSNKDNDPKTEVSRFGDTNDPQGGSWIYIETIKDVAIERGYDATIKEQDMVVHELGHSVGAFSVEPVTLVDDTNPNLPGASRYTEEYLNHIRSAEKPWSP